MTLGPPKRKTDQGEGSESPYHPSSFPGQSVAALRGSWAAPNPSVMKEGVPTNA